MQNIFQKAWKSSLSLLLAIPQLFATPTVFAEQPNIMGLPIEIRESTRDYADGNVHITQTKGSLSGIDDLYALANYMQVVDIEGEQVMDGISMANEEVANRIKEKFGEGTKVVFSYNESQDKATISFIDGTGQLLKDKENQNASYSFIGKERSNQLITTVNGVDLAINHSGSTIDLNFNDGTGWQPGELFFIPSQSSFQVKWVNALTGEDLYDSVTPTIFSGERYTTKALLAPDGFEYLGRLKTSETYETNQHGSFAEPSISTNQLDEETSTSGKFDYSFDQNLLANYTIQSYLEVGESYTVGLQDYVYQDSTKPIGQSTMTYKPIDLQVTRLNEAGDVRLLLTDHTTKEVQTLNVKHGEAAQYSNPNDFWHYYENNPAGDGWTARTFNNNLTLNSPADTTYVYRPIATEPTIEKKVEEKQHVNLINQKDSIDWQVTTSFGNQTSNWEQATIVDPVNPLLEIKKIEIVDESGTSVTNNGFLNIVDNTVTFNINKKEDNYSYLSDQTYTMRITTTLKQNVTEEELVPYLRNAGIPNQAFLYFGQDSQRIDSQIPTVSPPELSKTDSSEVEESSSSDEITLSSESQPVVRETESSETTEQSQEMNSQDNVSQTEKKPTITKDVGGKKTLKLWDTTDDVDWHINVTFGTNTEEWSRANIVDTIPDILEIEKVVVRNQDNKNVTHDGKLSIHNNRVEFVIQKKNGSFSYLTGESYTMTITTKMKQQSDGKITLYANQ